MAEEKRKIKYAVIAAEGIVENDKGQVLLSRRATEPHKGRWGFNGTYVTSDVDSIELQVVAQVKVETGLDVEITDLVDVFDGPWIEHSYEDANVHIVQVVYKTKMIGGQLRATSHADKHVWVSPTMAHGRRFAFNHRDMLRRYAKRKQENSFFPSDRSTYKEYYGTAYPYRYKEHVYVVPKSIIINEKNEILLAHRIQEPFVGTWDFPGGRMKAHESIKEALQREIIEELGVKSTVKGLFNVYSDKGTNPDFPRVMPLYFVDIHSTIFKKNIEMDDFKWFSLDALPDNVAYHIDHALHDISKSLLGNS